jgi:putative ABC transport system permease protein
MSRPPRRIILAWKNLTENPWRLAASVAGTAFAVVLMLMQNGFRNALLDNMVAVITHLDGDLFLTAPTRYILSEPTPFPRRRLELVTSTPGVGQACPLHLVADQPRWRNPLTGQTRRIRVLGFRPSDDLLGIAAVREQRDLWDRPDTALADDRSKSYFYGPLEPGTVSELLGRRLRIVGTFQLGTDFRSNGTLVMSEQNILRYFADRRRASWGDVPIDVGVVRIEPDASPDAVKANLARRLPRDVIVLTRAELINKERSFWEHVTPVGIVFDIGVVMGFIVGLAICYQVLFSEVSDRLAEFATLKAMGYTNGALLRIIVQEGIFLALLGYAAGLAIAVGLFRWLQHQTGLSMTLKPNDLAVILALTVVMCVLSGLLASQKLAHVDPADLYG